MTNFPRFPIDKICWVYQSFFPFIKCLFDCSAKKSSDVNFHWKKIIVWQVLKFILKCEFIWSFFRILFFSQRTQNRYGEKTLRWKFAFYWLVIKWILLKAESKLFSKKVDSIAKKNYFLGWIPIVSSNL